MQDSDFGICKPRTSQFIVTWCWESAVDHAENLKNAIFFNFLGACGKKAVAQNDEYAELCSEGSSEDGGSKPDLMR